MRRTRKPDRRELLAPSLVFQAPPVERKTAPMRDARAAEPSADRTPPPNMVETSGAATGLLRSHPARRGR